MHTPYDIFIDLSDQMHGSTNGKKPSIFHRDSDVHDVSGALRPGPTGTRGAAWKAVEPWVKPGEIML